jgi:hypothetical protein
LDIVVLIYKRHKGNFKLDAKHSSIEKAQNLATLVPDPALLVVEDARAGGEEDVAKVARGEQVDHPLLELVHLDIKAGADHAALVDAANELHHDLAGAVVVYDGELLWREC